jgi:peptide/nickel transport system substrate-binding protein
VTRARSVPARLAVICLTVAAALGGCATGGDEDQSARLGGSIEVGVPRLPAEVDPAIVVDRNLLSALWLVYTPLLTYRHAEGSDGTELVPGLARSLPDVSDDGLVYRLRLRRGLRYSNGVPVRPGDFERTVNRVRALGHQNAALYRDIRSIDADARSDEISVTLSRPNPAFEYVLALPSSAPLPRNTPAGELKEGPPPGVGPYRIAAVRRGSFVLVRSSDFRLPTVPAGLVDRIAMVRVGSPADQAEDVISGTLDVMQEQPPESLLPELRSDYRGRYREDVAAATVALVPDSDVKPFADPAVRRAVAASVDAETVARLSQGLLEPACNLLPPSVRGYQELDPCPLGERDRPPDLAAAREAVAESSRGDRVRLVAGHAVPERVSRYLVAQLRKIGLEPRLRGNKGARLRVERIAPPMAAPSSFLDPLAGDVFDPDVIEALSEAESAEGDEVDSAWAAVDERLVTETFAAPLGWERRPTFLADRLDEKNCAVFHPIFGIDLAKLCLK